MKLIQNYCTKSRAFLSTRRIVPQGVMIHSVGTPQPNAGVFHNIWNKDTAQVIVHALVDARDNVIQCLPWTHRAWHARFSANDTHIGVEMTEPATIRYTSGSNWIDLDEKATKEHVMASYRTSVELFAHICKLYNFNPLKKGVIVSHAEGYKLGIASNHGDPEHIWRKFGLSMDKFRLDIVQEMKIGGKIEEKVGASPEVERVKDIQTKLIALGYSPNGGVDGSYGPGTKTSVKSFQRDNGLTVDGLAGPLTMAKMNALIEKSKQAVKAPTVSPEIERVKDIQTKLITLGYSPNGGVDGLYGPGTKASVKSFQRDNGLTVDGSAGIITLMKMNELIEKSKESEVMFRVVVGSFNVKKNAELIQAELKRVRVDSFLIAYKDENGTIMYRVVAGTFAERENAVKRQEELKKVGHDSFLIAYKEEKK